MESMCTRIIDSGGKSDGETVVAFGDGGFSHASPGHGAAPTKGLYRHTVHCD